ncbi:MAG: DUF6291 domain-containing protein [Defluviitaleaceae bacterium]|nr:DUF6291 domain-containing protein [Defluviitaleaceae bacterium]
MRDSFVFYRSFYEAIEELPDYETKAMIYSAICKYALTGEEDELTGVPKAFFLLIKKCQKY